MTMSLPTRAGRARLLAANATGSRIEERMLGESKDVKLLAEAKICSGGLLASVMSNQ